jgi:hypothetical protein
MSAPRHWESTAVAVLLTAEVLALTVILLPLGLVCWVVGLVLLAKCRRWTRAQITRAALVLGTGLPVAGLALVASGMAFHAGGRVCSPGADGGQQCTYTGSGPAVLLPWLLAALGIAYAALQVVTARRLLETVGEHGPRPRGLRLR